MYSIFQHSKSIASTSLISTYCSSCGVNVSTSIRGGGTKVQSALRSRTTDEEGCACRSAFDINGRNKSRVIWA